MNEMQSVARLIQERQNKFIETRTIIENEVTRFIQSLEGLDPDVQARCEYTQGMRAKELLSALWEEPFELEKYDAQLSKFNAYVAKVRAVCDDINKEAIQCLQS